MRPANVGTPATGTERQPPATGPRTGVAGRWRTVGAAAAGVVVAVLAAVLAFGWPGQRASGPADTASPADYGPAPAYTLIDQHGQRFSSASLDGRVQVVSYLFPYCTSYCPLLAGALAEAERRADEAGLAGKVAFVAFNVDPVGAGPETLSAFLRQENLDPDDPAWHFLTGTDTQIRRVVTDGFHVFYQKVSAAEQEKIEAEQRAAGGYTPQPTAPNALADRAQPGYDIVHNDVVQIVDGHGRIRDMIGNGTVPSPDEIVAAVRRALD
jgi:protein SCO1/2